MNLIEKADILKHRVISNNVKEAVINSFIEDAQITNLMPLLGEAFYADLVGDPSKYANILEPKSYNAENRIYRHEGIKKVLCLFAYARYIMHGSYTDTPFGFGEKRTGDSDPVNTAQRKEIYKLNMQTAMEYWGQVAAYMDRHRGEYPLWRQGHSRRTFRVSKIG